MYPAQRRSIDEADLLQAEASLAARGYCVLESVLDSFEVADLHNRLAALAADEVRRGRTRPKDLRTRVTNRRRASSFRLQLGSKGRPTQAALNLPLYPCLSTCPHLC